jgi:transposase
MQDNDQKHVSHKIIELFERNQVNWWRTPPECPDLNPIENLWHELKEYLRARIKLRTLDELIAGIKAFWTIVDAKKCKKYNNVYTAPAKSYSKSY